MNYNQIKSRSDAIKEFGEELIVAIDKLPKDDNPSMDNLFYVRCGKLLATYILPSEAAGKYWAGKDIDWSDYWDGYYY